MSDGRRGFTLLELLVATALLISVVAVATVALNQMLFLVRRLQALQDMHGAAALVHQRLTREASSLHPCTALWLGQDANDGSVELVFMRGVEISGTPMFNTDQRWTRWHWSRATGVLSIAEGRGERNFLVQQSAAAGYWQFAGNQMTGSNRFLLVPQPVRDPGASGPQAPLDANRWDSGQAGDIGDHADLLRNAQPVLQHCTACTIEIVDLDGRTHTVDGNATGVELAAPGAFVDGRPYAGSGSAPSIIRLRFTLATPFRLGDDKTTVQATYSFSASTPADTRY